MPFLSVLANWKSIFSQSDTTRIKKRTVQNPKVTPFANDKKAGAKRHGVYLDGSKVISGRVTKGQRQGSSSNTEHILEGDTLVEAKSSSDAHEKGSSIADDDASDSDSEGKSHLLAQYLDGWSADELWLRERIDKRGEEPLMPDLWQWDFPSFPDSLFAPLDRQVMIKTANSSITEAVDQFASLVDNGARCRDLMDQDKICEPALAKGIERYRKWTLRDGMLQDSQCPQTTLTCAAKRHESVGGLMHRATQELGVLADQWRKLANSTAGKNGITFQMPTLCAFVIYHSVVQIICYDPNNPAARTRTLGLLNHEVIGHDVWHAFAIAIICIHARNQLVDLDSEGLFGKAHASIEDMDL